MRATDVLFGRRWRKLRLTTKNVNKGYYKGTGTGSMGRHTKYGGYVIEWPKVRTYVVPAGLSAFKVGDASWPRCISNVIHGSVFVVTDLFLQLTPFVTSNMRKTWGSGQYVDSKGPRSPELYLQRWKEENGLD